MITRGDYVHDLRHRYSLELRPIDALDVELRALALGLEEAGLVPQGASTKPRFHPHLTIGRAASTSADLVAHVASAVIAVGTDITFSSAATFGHGRIIYLELDVAQVAQVARAALVEHLPAEELDPLMGEREWTPHLTIAYSVPEATRDAALEHVRSALPIRGAFGSVQAWDLDVRPTVLMHRAEL